MSDLTTGNMKIMHVYTKPFFSIVIFFLTVTFALGQAVIPEKLWVHFDRPFYLTGETIWFKIYNTNFQEHSDHSQVVYLNLHDKQGTLHHQQKLELVDGKTSGTFDIPLSWDEDYYFITCFTKWNLQFSDEAIYLKKISIYNPYVSTAVELPSTENTKTFFDISTLHAFEQNISLDTDKPAYARRENVRLTLASLLKANCSISVSTLDQYEIVDANLTVDQAVPVHHPKDPGIKEKQITIEGMVKDPNSGQPVTSDVLSLYKTGSDQFYRISSTDGQVQILLDDFYGTETFQLFNMNPYQTEMVDFEMKINGEMLWSANEDLSSPARSKKINDYIKNARLRTKVNELFTTLKMDSLAGREYHPIAFKADKIYRMEKFKSMKTLEEFFKEIVVLVNITKKDEKRIVRLKNTETRLFFMESPWYLVDGFLTRDEERVLNIPFDKLTRVEIFNTNTSVLDQLESVMVRSGLIAVYTNDYYLKNHIEAQRNIIGLQGFHLSKEFSGVKSIPLTEARENPTFDPLLYWNPNVELNGTSTLEFVTSDLMGDFIIQVHGFTADGRRLYGSKIFSTQN